MKSSFYITESIVPGKGIRYIKIFKGEFQNYLMHKLIKSVFQMFSQNFEMINSKY